MRRTTDSSPRTPPRWLLTAAFAAAASVVAAAEPAELQRRLEDAVRHWDAAAAEAVLSEARAAGDGDISLRVRTGAAVASLLRAEYEAAPPAERAARRALGARIDAVAGEALGLIDQLPESARRETLRADLLGAQIRSDFRAQKLEPDLRAAVERALELDPDDPEVLVVAATPLVLAPEGRGRDLDEGERLARKALAEVADNERALLLLARIAELRGNLEEAAAQYRELLAGNPDCRPARTRLAALGDVPPP